MKNSSWPNRPAPAPFSLTPIDAETAPDAGAAAKPVPVLISVPCVDVSSSADCMEAGESLGRRHAPVWELDEAGGTVEAIAAAVGRPVGEIELILALKRKIQAEPRAASQDVNP